MWLSERGISLDYMNSLFQVEQIMEKFEKQFEDLDVRTQVGTRNFSF